jgi:D-inositol-3-phosphate glycosyltransferase
MFHTLGAVKNAIGIGENEPELRIEAERRLARTCQRIIASTEKERGYLGQYYGVPPEKITVIPCGVNLDLFRPVDKTESRKELGLGSGKIILFAGRVERLKGVSNLVRSVPLLNGLKPELIIAGEDGNRPGEISQLKNEAAELGISSRVTFTGLVKYSKLPYYYNAADVCVFPSYYESFGLVPLESLACGTPVIATDVGDLRSIIRDGENGYILGDNQPQHLAEKIETVLSGRQGGLTGRETIRASVLKYGWRSIAAEIEKEFWRKA